MKDQIENLLLRLNDGPEREAIASLQARIRELEAQVRVAYGFDRDAVFANIDQLRAALQEITTACEADCGIPDEGDGDDEAVGGGESGDMALTFGMLRRARSALEQRS